MRISLVPRTAEFYKLFDDAGQNTVEAAKLRRKGEGEKMGRTEPQDP